MSLDSVTPKTTSPWKLNNASKDKEATLPERQLLEAVERMDAFRENRVAAHIHLSRLQHHHRKEHHLRIAADTFEAQVKNFAGHIFSLSNGDLFFLGKDMRLGALIECVDRLRLFFAEDPLAQYAEENEQGSFATYYDFIEHYDQLNQDVLLLYKAAERLKKTKAESAAKGAPAAHGRPFQPSDLAKLIAILERADLTNVIRRQTACELTPAGIPRPLFRESFVSIDALQSICTPDIDLLSDRWLFHYLTRTLDLRMLAMLTADGIAEDVPVSLNLNLSTLLSPEFGKFDAIVPSSLRGKMVVEIHKVDVFSDIGAFIFARDFLHEHGYRLCLDGLTHHTLPFFDRNKLGLDLFKIYWAPEGLKTAHPSSYPEIAARLKDFGARHIVLARAENEEAVAAGRKLGITQFQGRYIDRLLGHIKKGARTG